LNAKSSSGSSGSGSNDSGNSSSKAPVKSNSGKDRLPEQGSRIPKPSGQGSGLTGLLRNIPFTR
jgi:hypothetical protein